MHHSGKQYKTMGMRVFFPVDSPTQFQMKFDSAGASLQKRNAIKTFCWNFKAQEYDYYHYHFIHTSE